MKLNEVVIGKVGSKENFFKFMDELNLSGDVFVVKPNWVDGIEGSFTEAKVLEFLFDYLKSKKIFVIESYTIWRNQLFVEQGKKEITKEKGNLVDAKPRWEWFRQQDDWFLETREIKALLKKYNVEYINITEEVWSERTASSELIKRVVDKKYSPLFFKEFYSYIPQKIFDLRGAALISFSKLKTEKIPFGIVASTKNFFGLIPDPNRWDYHGENNHELIPQAITDINKIYRTLFKTVFVTEGIFSATHDYMGRESRLVKNWGQIVGGRNSAEVDAVAADMIGVDYNKIGYLPLTIETFGDFNRKILNKIPREFRKELV